ncbi:MAG: PspC domain-containing protein [Saprospiraceae bacterium]
MNKVYNINLGGYPFVIDENAYDHLRTYLATLHRHFQHSEGCDEIITDIENRMAELLQERLQSRQIVTLQDIKESIKILGSPEDFSGEEDLFGEPAGDQSNAENTYRTGRRLYRNPDDKVIKGVCSGLAAYFGIEDAIWIRIAFALAMVSGGLGLPLYLILWAIMPEAKTAADRLAMRGEPINVSNIAKTVEEELNSLSDTLVEFGNQFTSKKKSPKRTKAESPVPLRKGFMY